MMLDTLARISLDLGRHEEGLERAEQALALVGDTKRYWIQASVLNTVAAAHRGLARPDRALQADGTALALAREVMSKRAEADTLLSLGVTYRHLDRHEEARAGLEQALRLARDHSFRVVEGQALTALCATARAPDIELAEEALAVHRATGHRPGEARTLLALARAHRPSGRATAERLDRQARCVLAKMGVPEQEYDRFDD